MRLSLFVFVLLLIVSVSEVEADGENDDDALQKKIGDLAADIAAQCPLGVVAAWAKDPAACGLLSINTQRTLLLFSILEKAEAEYRNKKDQESIMVSYPPEEEEAEEKDVPKQIPRPVPAGGRTRCDPGFTLYRSWCYRVDVRNVPGTDCGNLDVLDASWPHGSDADVRNWIREFFWLQTKSCPSDIPFMVARGAIPKCVGVRHGFVEEFDCGAGPTRPVCRVKAEEMACDSRVPDEIVPLASYWTSKTVSPEDPIYTKEEWERAHPKFDWRKYTEKEEDEENKPVPTCPDGTVCGMPRDAKTEFFDNCLGVGKCVDGRGGVACDEKVELFDRDARDHPGVGLPLPHTFVWEEKENPARFDNYDDAWRCDHGYVFRNGQCFMTEMFGWVFAETRTGSANGQCVEVTGRPTALALLVAEPALAVWIKLNFATLLDADSSVVEFDIGEGPRQFVRRGANLFPVCFYPAKTGPRTCDDANSFERGGLAMTTKMGNTKKCLTIAGCAMNRENLCVETSKICNGHGTLKFSVCLCQNGWDGRECETAVSASDFDLMPSGQIWLNSNAQSVGASARPPPPRKDQIKTKTDDDEKVDAGTQEFRRLIKLNAEHEERIRKAMWGDGAAKTEKKVPRTCNDANVQHATSEYLYELADDCHAISGCGMDRTNVCVETSKICNGRGFVRNNACVCRKEWGGRDCEAHVCSVANMPTAATTMTLAEFRVRKTICLKINGCKMNKDDECVAENTADEGPPKCDEGWCGFCDLRC